MVGQGADGPGSGLVDGGDAQGGVTNVADESFEFGVGGGGFQQSGKHGWGGGCSWGGRLGAHGWLVLLLGGVVGAGSFGVSAGGARGVSGTGGAGVGL